MQARIYQIFALILLLAGGSTLGLTWRTLPFAVFVIFGSGILASRLIDRTLRPPRSILLFALVCVAVIAMQIIPVPAEWIADLPGRDLATSMRSLTGSAPFHALTIDLAATLQATFQVLIFLIALIFASCLRADDRGKAIAVIVAAAVICIFASLTQRAADGNLLDLYNSSHIVFGPGFFANRNHTAIFLASAITMAVVPICRRLELTNVRFAVFAFAVTTGLAFILLSGSRAGLSIAMAMFGLSFLQLYNFSVKNSDGLVVRQKLVSGIITSFVTIGVIALLYFNSAAKKVAARFEDLDSDSRWSIWINSIEIAQAYWPFGSGLGTFATTYAAQEEISELTPNYVNHAHSDWIEIFVEFGVLALPPGLVFAYILMRGWSQLAAQPDGRALEGRVCGIVLFGLAVHSLVDYPLRSPALALLAATALGIFARVSLPITRGKIAYG